MAAAWSPRVETFAFFCGIIYFAVGLLGLTLQAGLFPENLVHNGMHVAFGAWGIAAGRSVMSPRMYARIVAIAFAAAALMDLAPGLDTVFGALPVDGNDVWLHAGTAAAATYFGWHPDASIERRAARNADRRQRAEPVARERRSDHPDRRSPGSEV
jgi:hypothetical protein